MYLLDTDTLSLLRRRQKFPQVAAWAAARPVDTLFLSVVTLAEVETGIHKVRRHDPAFADALRAWIDHVRDVEFKDRILPMDTAAAMVWGQMAARIGNSENDLMIAAIAQVHGLTVVTRNVRHFAPTGVPVFDPMGQGAA
ncbi:type II toxin-antitoxin system VapC family toxin [Jannaschia donghaensis]|uniref:Ribonuclease VapC n=1 Tax=Jannaschia donghaensis TaxID=420998 RepID=A0A0M6YCE5_9RHOB|nr:type II toxin-antitoxin system VapC family toxin [Jannaschia donghaensis]CTQ48031.1 putative ribonuclease FitB [Jannaschia donghaensis]